MRNKSFPNGEKGDGQSVKTQFAINIPRAAAGNNGSRATADQTQGDGKNFLGMENIWLLEFSTTPGDNTTCSNATNLEAISAKDDENSSSFDENNSRKIYQNVNVNTGTNNFLFYGFGKVNDKTIGTFDDTFSPSSSTSTSDIKFWLKPIIDETTDIYEDEEAKNILTALNAVANVDWGTNLSTMKKNFLSLHAGSANSIRGMFQEIYDYAINPHSATETTVVESLKKAITTSKYFTIDEEGEAATIKTNLTYPKNVGLPDGAVSLSYNEKTSKFEYDQASNLTGIRNINPESITYPALLSYYVNTPIRTNDNTVATTDWPANTTDWATDTKWVNGWSKNATVTRTTHAIALMNNINYGVASLKLQVKCNADQNKLKDKDDEDIDIPSGGFKVTGLLIGNQPKGVDYEFSPILSSRADNFSQTIWDSNVNLSATTSTPSDANYTIVLPNLIDGTEQNEVSFAVELENNADRAFKGHDGIIEKNAKFYLVGKLTPKTNDTDSDAKAVFQSDYQTTVTANISTLKNAYNCIPDIRTTEMQLGLSVDLQWEKGFSYDITIGGDNN